MDVIYFRLQYFLFCNAYNSTIYRNDITEIVLSLCKFTEIEKRCYCCYCCRCRCCHHRSLCLCRPFSRIFCGYLRWVIWSLLSKFVFIFYCLYPQLIFTVAFCCLSIAQTKSAKEWEKECEWVRENKRTVSFFVQCKSKRWKNVPCCKTLSTQTFHSEYFPYALAYRWAITCHKFENNIRNKNKHRESGWSGWETNTKHDVNDGDGGCINRKTVGTWAKKNRNEKTKPT